MSATDSNSDGTSSGMVLVSWSPADQKTFKASARLVRQRRVLLESVKDMSDGLLWLG